MTAFAIGGGSISTLHEMISVRRYTKDRLPLGSVARREAGGKATTFQPVPIPTTRHPFAAGDRVVVVGREKRDVPVGSVGMVRCAYWTMCSVVCPDGATRIFDNKSIRHAIDTPQADDRGPVTRLVA